MSTPYTKLNTRPNRGITPYRFFISGGHRLGTQKRLNRIIISKESHRIARYIECQLRLAITDGRAAAAAMQAAASRSPGQPTPTMMQLLSRRVFRLLHQQPTLQCHCVLLDRFRSRLIRRRNNSSSSSSDGGPTTALEPPHSRRSPPTTTTTPRPAPADASSHPPRPACSRPPVSTTATTTPRATATPSPSWAAPNSPTSTTRTVPVPPLPVPLGASASSPPLPRRPTAS